MDEKINNWKAAQALEEFLQKTLEPMRKRIIKADDVLNDKKFAWKPGQKEKALHAYEVLQAEYMDAKTLYLEVFELIKQHESISNMLTEVYMEWYNKVSRKGEQPVELMTMQAKILEKIFSRIRNTFDYIEELRIPKKDEKGLNN